jgi:hypothetical protein
MTTPNCACADTDAACSDVTGQICRQFKRKTAASAFSSENDDHPRARRSRAPLKAVSSITNPLKCIVTFKEERRERERERDDNKKIVSPLFNFFGPKEEASLYEMDLGEPP